MKDKLYIGLLAGIFAPFPVILLFYLTHSHSLTLPEFIELAIWMRVDFKLFSVCVFFADLGLFYLFLHYNKNNAVRGVILAVFIYFFAMLFLYYL